MTAGDATSVEDMAIELQPVRHRREHRTEDGPQGNEGLRCKQKAQDLLMQQRQQRQQVRLSPRRDD